LSPQEKVVLQGTILDGIDECNRICNKRTASQSDVVNAARRRKVLQGLLQRVAPAPVTL
jgi:hypothetical protein